MPFLLLLAVRLVCALVAPISDCDETFNYWEPTHYLLYGRGLQTWEYSPAYALRSYLYLLPHAAVARAATFLLATDKRVAFYAVRCALGAFSALCEARFARAVGAAFGRDVGATTLAFLLTAAGLFHASVAFLPSTFAMHCFLLSTAAWVQPKPDYAGAIFGVAAAALLGWPFAALLGAPLALDALATTGLLAFLLRSAAAAAALLGPAALVDSWLYGRLVIAPLNILLYNRSAATGSGSQLYGVEAWHFYLQNLALNLNALLPAALLALPLLAVPNLDAPPRDGGGHLGRGRQALVLSGALLWLAFFSAIPHKEERFMFPIYPLLCVAAAVAVVRALRLVTKLLPPRPAPRALTYAALWALAVGGSAALSFGRSAALVVYYGAPLPLYSDLSALLAARGGCGRAGTHTHGGGGCRPARVCVGKEWYRFPSHFFLPADAELAFVRGGFGGQLPAPYVAPPPAGARAVPGHFNDQNREEPGRYAPIKSCDWLVELELPTDAETPSRKAKEWRVAARRPFLDAARTPAWARALYVPGLAAKHAAYAEYVVLERRK